jgi:hypothetical protein
MTRHGACDATTTPKLDRTRSCGSSRLRSALLGDLATELLWFEGDVLVITSPTGGGTVVRAELPVGAGRGPEPAGGRVPGRR